ncbi:MAG: ribonuclease R [Desulfobulbaceae bacterium]|nr:MAG: ribonuclease R [Desulfobulbaceae bacterium]
MTRKRKIGKGKKRAAERVGSIFGLGTGVAASASSGAGIGVDAGAKRKNAEIRRGNLALKSAGAADGGQEYQAMVSMHQRGFGFAMLVDPAEAAQFKKDIFLPPGSALGGAIHGDRVLVQVTKQSRDRAEGRVLAVLQRGITRLVGFYVAGKGRGLVVPEDDRLPYKIAVKRSRALGARDGDAVYVEIEKFRDEGNPEGRILEVLGDPTDARVQIEMAIRGFELPFRFADDLLVEAEDLNKVIRLSKQRQDLRDLPFVTIDGDDARDFDDAVAVESRPFGFRLYVAVADVSYYVKPGSRLDAEAYARGTSVYFPGRVLPMLPERLSNNLCSLMPGVARYTLTAIIDFDQKGQRRQAVFQRSLIKSRHRLTYGQVRAILEDREPELCRRYADVLADLGQLQRLATRLNQVRMSRGSIGFEIPEADIQLDEEGRVARICRSERNIAHKLIEECMLAANEAVAEFLEKNRAEVLYRIHEEPDPVKVAGFAEFAGCLGLKIPLSSGTSAWFGQVLQAVEGTPREYIVSNLLLRSMQQARYAPKNVGHFGLAATHYTHFTSPIRRYPDLLVHRVLTTLLGDKNKKRSKPEILAAGRSVDESAIWLSRRERVAVDAERNVNDRLAALHMSDRVGEEFAAVVSGVGSFGIFVELIEIMLSGAVALAEMVDDYYQVEEKSHRLVGRRTGKIYQVGDLVQVRLNEVDQRRRRLNFVLV